MMHKTKPGEGAEGIKLLWTLEIWELYNLEVSWEDWRIGSDQLNLIERGEWLYNIS